MPRVTLLTAAEPTALEPVLEVPQQRRGWRSTVELVAAVLAVIGFELVVVQAVGGREEGAVTKGLLTLVPALVLSRPWARLAPGVLLVAALPALGALYLCLFSPLRWAGADQLATAGYAGLLFLTIAAAGSSAPRRSLLSSCLAWTGAFQALYAIWVWSADGGLSEPLIGTYYWHNPFAAHVGAAALMLVTAHLTRPARARPYALVGAVLCLVAVWLSTSRATSALVVLLGVLLVGGLLVRSLGGRRRTALRGGVLVLIVLAAISALAPLVSADGPGRTETESLSGSGSHRLSFYRAAASVVQDHPLTGVGAGAYSAAASLHQGPDEARVRSVHSGILQAAVEGGVPLAVAYAVPLVIAAGAWLRRVRRGRTDPTDVPLLYGAGAAAALLAAHSLIDFDWTFPALPALLAALLALIVSVPVTGARARPGVGGRWPAVAVLVLAVLALAVSLRADVADTAVRSGVLPEGRSALTGTSGPLRDARFDRIVLRDPATDVPALRRALERTADPAERDFPLQWLRAEARLRLGEQDAALSLAEDSWARIGTRAPLQALGYAQVLDAAGAPAEAEAVLAQAARRLLAAGPAGPARAEGLVQVLLSRPGSQASDETRCLAAAVSAALPQTRLPVPANPRPETCS